jgi:hypothetical protein
MAAIGMLATAISISHLLAAAWLAEALSTTA